MNNLVGSEGNFNYPGFDYAAEQTKIARRQALMQALQKQSLEPLQTDRSIGGWAIPTSPFEGAAKLLQGYAAAKQGGKASEEQSALATKAQGDYRTALSTALKNSGVSQEDIDSLTAAGSNPMAQQMMPMISGIVQQKRQMQMLKDWLGNRGQTPPAGPQAGEGTVLAPGMSGTSQGSSGPPMGNLPAGSDLILGGGMIGMPSLSEVGKNVFEQSKPIVQREGGLTDWQGNQITPPLPKAPEGFGLNRSADGKGYQLYKLPGAGEVPAFKGQEAGAVSRAQTENTLHPVTLPSGASVQMPGSGLMPPAQGIPTGAPQGQPLNIGQPTEAKDYAGKLAGAREDYTKSAMAAQESLPSIQLMKDAMANGLKTNNLAPYSAAIGGWLNSVGIDPKKYGITDPTNAQEFTKGATKLVADMTRALGGREPFQAMQFVQKGNPGLTNTIDANIKLISLVEGTKQWEIARDQQAQAWADKHGGTTSGFIQDFQKNNPVQKFWQQSYDAFKGQMSSGGVSIDKSGAIVKGHSGTGKTLNWSDMPK